MHITSLVHRFELCLCAIALILCASADGTQAAKNIILMIGDGMGYQQVNAGSYYLSGKAGQLCFQPYYKCGVTTRSLDNPITDSAAAASALATGCKVNNNAISQNPAGKSCETILERATSLGKKTGLVTTDPITRATPAAFGAHDPSRYNYIPIGDDYLNSSRPNILFGGGATPAGGGTYFSSTQVANAKAQGYKAVYTAQDMAALSPEDTNRAIGLFSLNDMTYEYDRPSTTTEPHLSQMTGKALSLLDNDPDGFFLMVEGAKVDYGAHANDIVRTTGEVVEFNNAVQTVLNWMNGRNDTLLIVTADHETGGLTATNRGIGNYAGAVWKATDHTGANVPLYATGMNVDLINSYIKNGVIDNTDVYRIMKTAYNTPVPEPSSIFLLISGISLLAWRQKMRN